MFKVNLKHRNIISSSVVKRNNNVYLSGMLTEQQYNTLINDGKQLIFAMTFFPLHGKRPFLRELRLKTVLMIYRKRSHTRSSNLASMERECKICQQRWRC